MTELETMQRAKQYIHKLANGIDPLTDRPLPHDTVLHQVIDRAIEQESHPSKRAKKELPPFSLTPEQKQQVLLVHNPIPISQFVQAANAVADLDHMQKLKATDLTAWLVRKGFLQEVIRNDKRQKEPTANRNAIGITSEWRQAHSTGAHYLAILYNYGAQQFLLDHLESVFSEESVPTE